MFEHKGWARLLSSGSKAEALAALVARSLPGNVVSCRMTREANWQRRRIIVGGGGDVGPAWLPSALVRLRVRCEDWLEGGETLQHHVVMRAGGCSAPTAQNLSFRRLCG